MSVSPADTLDGFVDCRYHVYLSSFLSLTSWFPLSCKCCQVSGDSASVQTSLSGALVLNTLVMQVSVKTRGIKSNWGASAEVTLLLASFTKHCNRALCILMFYLYIITTIIHTHQFLQINSILIKVILSVDNLENSYVDPHNSIILISIFVFLFLYINTTELRRGAIRTMFKKQHCVGASENESPQCKSSERLS